MKSSLLFGSGISVIVQTLEGPGCIPYQDTNVSKKGNLVPLKVAFIFVQFEVFL